MRRHPSASAFHTPAWLEALKSTCGYEPLAFTVSPEGSALDTGAVFCLVRSPLTGHRLVSLPYADHCALLDNDARDLAAALQGAMPALLQEHRTRYAELRTDQPLPDGRSANRADSTYKWHMLDLAPDLPTLRAKLHRNSIHRKIRRAERDGLRYFSGSGEELLRDFYSLLLITRRRHRLPPHPKRWFRALRDGFGEAFRIRVARLGRRPVAAILTLRHRDTLVFKQGCSDERFHASGGTPFLLWQAIRESHELGLRQFDLGRSDPEASGLITFKNRWGADLRTLTYSRFSVPRSHPAALGSSREAPSARFARNLIAALPNPLFRACGNLLFPHFG